MMKILMIAPTPFFSHRGCHIRIFEEASALIRAGHQVKIVTYHLGENVCGLDVERTPCFFWYKKTEPGPSWHKIYLDFFLLLKAFFCQIKFNPDIIHCHLHEGAVIGLILKLFSRKEVVFDSQGSLVGELENFAFFRIKPLLKLIAGLEKSIYRLSQKIIVSNQSNFDVLVEKFGISYGKIRLIPDGIDISKSKAEKHMGKELSARYVPAGKKTIVYLGTLNKIEGIDELLDLAKKLKFLRSDFNLLVMGYPDVDFYKQKAKQANMEGFVQFMGKINYDLVYEYLALGNFLVSLKLPTTEGNGKLLNYAVSGKPIICYNHATNRSILGNSALYLDFSAGCEQNAREVSRFLDLEEEKLRDLSARAKKEVEANYSWDNLVKDLLKFYGSKN